MNFQKQRWLQSLFTFGHKAKLRPGPQAKKPTLGRLEALEDRSVPASLFVDLPGAFTLTKDVGPAGFSDGDIVTWNGSKPVSDLVVGKEAFGSVTDAVKVGQKGDTIFLAPQDYKDGLVTVGVSGLTVNVPAGTGNVAFQMGNAQVTDFTLTGDGNSDIRGNQWNNRLEGNSGNNQLNAEYNIADVLKADPTTPVSIPTTASGTRVDAIAPNGRLVSEKGENFFVFRLRNGTANPTPVNARTSDGVQVLTNFVLPANTDTFVAVPTNSSWSSVTLTGSGINGFPKANGSTGMFSLTAGGDDSLVGGAGNDELLGGLGLDTGVYSGNRTDYTIMVEGALTIIQDNRDGSPDGRDLLMGVERVEFADGSFIPTPSQFPSTAGQYNELVFSPTTVSGWTTVVLTLDGSESDGVLVAENALGVTVSGSGTNQLVLSGSTNALNAFLSTKGMVSYKAATDQGRTLTLGAKDGSLVGFSLITFESASEGPVFTSEAKAGFIYGQGVKFQFEAKASSEVVFKVDGLPAGLDVTPEGILYGSARAGEYTFKVYAFDAKGRETVQVFTLVIEQAELVIGAQGVNKAFDGTASATVQWSDNRIGGDKFDIVADASFENAQVGVDKAILISNIRLVGDDASNYRVVESASARANIIGSGIVNGALTVVGSGQDDHIIIARQNATQLVVVWTIGNNPTTYTRFNLADMNRVVVFGVDGNDRLTMNAEVPFDVTLVGGNGDDILRGGNGNDTILGGAGNDTLYGSLGNDTLDGGLGSDTLFGQAGNDLLIAGEEDNLPNTLDGGDGADTLIGSGGNDTLTGGGNGSADGADLILGLGGDDTIFGGGGNDVLDGGAGNDAINGGAGDDLIVGGDGNDQLVGEIGNDTILGNAGNDNLQGGDGHDILVGGAGNDNLAGSSGQDILIGGLGQDTLRGENGDDIIIGGSTTHDENVQSLQSIRAEWIRTDLTMAQKRANIGQGVGANGSVKLDNSTVIDDLTVDQVFASTGDDWTWF